MMCGVEWVAEIAMGNGNLYVHKQSNTSNVTHNSATTHSNTYSERKLIWLILEWKLLENIIIGCRLSHFLEIEWLWQWQPAHTHRPVHIAIPLQIIWSNCVYFSRFCLPSPPSLDIFRFEDGCAFATSMSSSYFLWQKVTRNLRALLQLIMFSLWHRKTFHSFEHVRVRRMRFTLVPPFFANGENLFRSVMSLN